jgi:hypothetical protein
MQLRRIGTGQKILEQNGQAFLAPPTSDGERRISTNSHVPIQLLRKPKNMKAAAGYVDDGGRGSAAAKMHRIGT